METFSLRKAVIVICGRRKLKPYPKAAFTTGLSSSFFFWYSSACCCSSCSCLKLLVVWRLFLNAVTVATVPRALSSTLTVQALDTSSTPSKRRPERVRHLQSTAKNIRKLGLLMLWFSDQLRNTRQRKAPITNWDWDFQGHTHLMVRAVMGARLPVKGSSKNTGTKNLELGYKGVVGINICSISSLANWW